MKKRNALQSFANILLALSSSIGYGLIAYFLPQSTLFTLSPNLLTALSITMYSAIVLAIVQVIYAFVLYQQLRSEFNNLLSSSLGLNQLLEDLLLEDDEVIKRLLGGVIDKVVEDPNGTGKMLSNVSGQGTFNMISQLCSEKITTEKTVLRDILSSAITKERDSEFSANDINERVQTIQSLEEIHKYCSSPGRISDSMVRLG